jgi:hypothetical protein
MLNKSQLNTNYYQIQNIGLLNIKHNKKKLSTKLQNRNQLSTSPKISQLRPKRMKKKNKNPNKMTAGS